MKNKIIKSLEKHTIVIPVSIFLAVIVGVFVYNTVGRPPTVEITDQDDSLSIANIPSQNLKNGDDISLAFPKGGRVDTVYVERGESVHKGQMLASLSSVDAKGLVSQAQGVLESSKANYNKLLNGATGSDIDVYKSAVNKAQTNLNQITSTQNTLVANAYNNLLNSTFEAIPSNSMSTYTAPIISGTYTLGKEGSILINTYFTSSGATFSLSGLTTGTGTVSTTTAQPLGDSGLYIKFPSMDTVNNNWIINIPNKKSNNYLANYNAYQSALSLRTQSIAQAQSDLNQAETTLASKQATARPEDIAIAKAAVDSAQGALQIAQGAYSNNFIYAPEDGVITVVNIHSGEIAVMNQKALGMIITIKK